MRNVAQPISEISPEQLEEPNECPTWYTAISANQLSDSGDLETTYFYQASHSPYMIWFGFTSCGLNRLSKPHKLSK